MCHFVVLTNPFNEKEASMALIQTVSPEKAEGETKEVYGILQKNIGVIPAPMELASASPGILRLMWQSLQYYSQHPDENLQNGSGVLNF